MNDKLKSIRDKRANEYACGYNRNDPHGISSFPDTAEEAAFIKGFDSCYSMLKHVLGYSAGYVQRIGHPDQANQLDALVESLVKCGELKK